VSVTLRRRLVLSHLLVVLTSILLAGLLTWISVERMYLRSQSENLLAQAKLIAAALQDADLPLQASEPYSQITNIQPGIHTRLLTEGGGVAFSLPLLPGGEEVPVPFAEQIASVSPTELLAREEIQEAMTGLPTTAVRRVQAGGGGRVLYAAAPVHDSSGDLSGIVYLAMPLPAGGLPFETLLKLGGAVLAAGLLAGLAGIYLARRLAQPLEQLSQAAKALGSGDLKLRLPSGSRVRELDELGNSFNRMAADLENEKQVRDAFLADVTHELRTPLTVIQGTIETLQDGALDDRTGRQNLLEGMQRETARLARLVNDLLVLTRADAGALQLDLKPLDLPELVRQRCERFSVLAAENKVTLRVLDETGNAMPRTVMADADRLAQVLDNLLDNALRYSPTGGEISVAIHREEEEALVSVIDQGTGIPAEHLERVFERFYRVEPARDRRSGGSGLGLAIARSLIEAQGGGISAKSEPGQGAEMTFWLPLN
jgi:signal transduction histidine kinase